MFWITSLTDIDPPSIVRLTLFIACYPSRQPGRLMTHGSAVSVQACFMLLQLVSAGLLACNGVSRDALARESTTQNAPSDELLLAASKVALPPPGVVPEYLPDPESEGARLVQQYCTACHELPTPKTHSRTDWPRVTRRMWLRIDGLEPGFAVPVPTSAERLMILRYLIDNALRVSGTTLPAGPERAFFSATCSRCHELPDLGHHSYEEWVVITRRMMDRMETMLGVTLTPEEYSKIVLYLETTSEGTP
jgi:cytochrome c5